MIRIETVPRGYRLQSRTSEILRWLALGAGVITLSLIAPQLPGRLLHHYLRQKLFRHDYFKRDLRRLQARNLIAWHERPDGTVRIMLTRRGKKVALRYKLEEISIRKPKQWDRTWRFVMFDIPHHKKRARDDFRKKLNELGFYQLQKSVFVHPFPCEDEIDFISTLLEVRQHVLLITAPPFEGSEKILRQYFRLS